MNFFNNLKVSLKLSILILIAFISMGIIGFTGYYYLQKSDVAMTKLYTDRFIPVKLLNEMRSYIRTSNSALLELMLTTDNQKNQDLQKIINTREEKINDGLAVIEQSHLDSTAMEMLAKIRTSRQKYTEAKAQVLQLALENKNTEAYALYVKNVDPLANDYAEKLRDLSDYYAKLSEQMNHDNTAELAKATKTTATIAVIAFLVLGVSGFSITQMIVRPLHIMVSICEEFAAGDFRDKPRKLLRKDEVGHLGDALVNLRDSLRAMMKKVNESAEHVAASSEELTASADQSAQATNQVASSIIDVATDMQDQLSATNNASAIVQQMSASIQQIAANANEVASQAVTATDKANEGNRAVTVAMQQMSQIGQTVTASAQVVTRLGDRSKEIGQIVDTISGIAGQTNLLALNAAIEAARAGEQGRGFAVVAEEVRKLAEQSQEAAKQIAHLIGEIQEETDKAVLAMNDGTREVKRGEDVVNSAGQDFQEITTLITRLSDQVREISAAIEQMAVGSQHIVTSVKQVDELSKKASGETQSISAATEEQAASMQEIASASQSLAHLATDLHEAVEKFQL